jgi:hypothetical protein
MGENVVTDFERQSIVDSEHLKMLAIGNWVMGGLMALYGLLMGAYFAFIGTIFFAIPQGSDGPPAFFPWIFIGAAVFAILVVGVFATLVILSGFWIRKRRHRVFSMVLAGFLCLSIPFGTMLGVATFLVLGRASVAALYGQPTVPALPLPDAAADVEASNEGSPLT